MPEKIKLQKFVDELPIPNTISPKKRSNNSSYYEVTMKEFSQKLHRDLGPTRLWGYEGIFPGPTFEVMKIETVFVKWINDLPNKHFLPVDTTIHGSEITLPEGRSVVIYTEEERERIVMVTLKHGLREFSRNGTFI